MIPAAAYSALRLSRMRATWEKFHVEDRVDVGRRAPAHDHVLGDLAPHHRHRLDSVIAVTTGRHRVEMFQDVGLGDTAAGSGPLNRRHIDVVLTGQSADDR